MIDITDEHIEVFLEERFEENLERIQEETGAGLAPDIKAMAFQQVLLYWRKLKDIATRVTETEVRLNLPCQRTPRGIEYGIEGVVDIVREDEKTVMYDIKTHDTDYVRTNWEEYSWQLNIYAHIWQILRQQDLDQTAVITTSFPDKLAEAIAIGDEPVIEHELAEWHPLVEIPFDASAVESAIQEFSELVDQIEAGEFKPPSVSVLRSRTVDNKVAFAQRICRNCDARFSCRSYRRYAKSSSDRSTFSFREYYKDDAPQWEKEDRLTSMLETIPEVEEFEELIG